MVQQRTIAKEGAIQELGGGTRTLAASVGILAVNVAAPARNMVPLVIDQAPDTKTPAGRSDGGANAVGAGAVVTGGRRDGRVERAPVVTLGEARIALSHGLRDRRGLGLGLGDRVGCHAGNERDDGQEECCLHFDDVDTVRHFL
jgi:hypothetical protein